MKFPIYTIGYGNRNINDFQKILEKYGIEYLIDVRSQPHSKFNEDFNQNELKFFLKKNCVTYVYMGNVLGGKPKDINLYTDGKVDYHKLSQSTNYLDGIKRLNTAYNKNIKVALMCSELKPEDCHRSKLIGKTLYEMGIDVQHIDEYERLKTQLEIIDKATHAVSEVDLFGINTLYSRNVYINDGF